MSTTSTRVSTMPKAKINDTKLLRLIDRGESQSRAAEILGVSRQAVNKRLLELRGRTTKVVVAKKVEKVIDRKLDAIDQLQKVNQVAHQLLNELTGEDQVIDRMVKAVEGSLVYEGDPIKQKEHIRRVILRVNQDKNTALKTCGEIRNQLELQLKIFQTIFDMRAVEEFQNEVLQTISEVSPELRNKIITRLNQKRALSSALRFH